MRIAAVGWPSPVQIGGVHSRPTVQWRMWQQLYAPAVSAITAMSQSASAGIWTSASVTCPKAGSGDIVDSAYDTLSPTPPTEAVSPSSSRRLDFSPGPVGRRSSYQSQAPDGVCYRWPVANGASTDRGRLCRERLPDAIP